MLNMEPVTKLSKDLKEASRQLSTREVRYLVDSYYSIQEYRKATGNQIKALVSHGEPHEVISWFFDNTKVLENEIKKAMDAYSLSSPVGQWSRQIRGIGPVIAAGLLAHIDITRASTAGAIWRYAGLDPSVTWGKGEKRPWNASLKTLCWKIGESFVKMGNESFYNRLYAERKEFETEQNEQLAYAEQAAQGAQRVGKGTESYKYYIIGKLPPGHIHQRAKRYAVKIFLAHWHEVAYEFHYGKQPPNPYVLEHLGHAHKIERPV